MKTTADIEQELEGASKAVVAQGKEKSTRRSLKGTAGKAVSKAVSFPICFSLFQLVTGYSPLIAMYQRLIYVIFGFTLIFLLFPLSTRQRKNGLSWDGFLFVGLLLYISYYVVTLFAGAIESASGVGGQFMAPVMGGSVFLMMEIRGDPTIPFAGPKA